MGKQGILIARAVFPEVIEKLKQHFEVETNPSDALWTAEQLRAKLAGKAGAFTTGSERIDAGLLAACPDLEICANMAVGYNNFDVAAMTARGVLATNAPDVLTETTADFGFALLMATARRITESEHFLRAGRWDNWAYDMFAGAEVHGSTLAILGMGRIGQGIAQRAAHGFGMRVLYHNRSRLPESIESNCRAQYVDFATLLEEADHLVLVLPYSADTHHVIDSAALAKMKSTATLINIGRGGLVDEGALADALAAGKLFAAGLDVFEGEPDINPKLLALRNVVLTPHVGSASLSTRRAMATLAVDNLIAALGHGPQAGQPATPVNAVDVAAHIAKTGKSITGKR